MLAQLGSAASRYARTAGGDPVSASRAQFHGVVVPDSAKRIPRKRSFGFIFSDVALVIMPWPSFIKKLTEHAFDLIVVNSNHF